MASPVPHIIVISFVLCLGATCDLKDGIYMNNHCYETNKVKLSIRIEMIENGTDQRDDCNMTWYARPGQQLMIRPNSQPDWPEAIVIQAGNKTEPEKLDDKDGVKSNVFILTFKPGVVIPADGSDVLITSFVFDDKCVDGFRCEGGECINKTLQCDGMKNCPNAEDEEDCADVVPGISPGTIAAIAVAGVAVISFSLFGIFLLARRKRTNKKPVYRGDFKGVPRDDRM